jgi:glycerophosphoryl diester phosphodiesterase
MTRHEVAQERGMLRIGALSWVLTSLLVVLIVLDPNAASATHPLQLHGALQRDHSVGIVAHRGAAALAPENTLAAFKIAIEQGADFVETDVQLTADGVPVLMHDPDLDRTTNGRGPLSAHTAEQVAALDAGSWYSPEFAGEQVPTLTDFVTLLNPAPIRAFLELKGEWPAERVSETLDLLRSHHLVHRVVIASFERTTLEAVRDLAPEYATILLTRDLSADTVEYAVDLKVSAVCARSKLLASHPRSLDALQAAGIGVIAYTLNTPKQWQQAADLGVDFTVTDDPVALAEWRAETDG